MSARLFPHPILSVLLVVVWVLAYNSLAPGVVLLGVVLGVCIPLITRSFWPEAPQSVRLAPIPLFLVRVVFDIVVANVRVAWLILGPSHRIRPRFLEVPLELQSPWAITTLAGIITLTPGTVSANLSGDRRTLLVHALSADDAEGAIASIKRRYERPLREIFEC